VNLAYLIGFTFNAIFSFSIKPLRMFSLLGAIVLASVAVLASVYVVMRFFTSPPRGVTTVLLLLLVNLGVMSLGIGVLGEYIAKIYSESKHRPLWLVDYTLNLEPAALDGGGGPGLEPEHRMEPLPGRKAA
jgi:dolichol-phosphate mannosyltransferase